MFSMIWGGVMDEGQGPYVNNSENAEQSSEENIRESEDSENHDETIDNNDTEDHISEPSVETSVDNQPKLRRSERQVKRPGYLDDYALLMDIECERLLLSINDEPGNFQEAKKLTE